MKCEAGWKLKRGCVCAFYSSVMKSFLWIMLLVNVYFEYLAENLEISVL